MYKYAMVTPGGEPAVVVRLAEKSKDKKAILITEDISDVDLLDSHWLSGKVWKLRGKRPSFIHEWNPKQEVWVLNIGALKDIKKKTINADCRNYIISGFSSSALGSVHTYPYGVTDQANLSNDLTLASINPDMTFQLMCADESKVWGFKAHSSEQVKQIGIDAYNHVLNARQKNISLQNAADLSTTEEDTNSIVW
jgi:hypothetical protein